MNQLWALVTTFKGRDAMSYEGYLAVPVSPVSPAKSGRFGTARPNEEMCKTVKKIALHRTIATGLAMLALATVAIPARATLLLPVANGDFSMTPGLTTGTSASFTTGQVTDWMVSASNAKVYLYFPNTALTPGATYTHGVGAQVELSGTASDYPISQNFVGVDSDIGTGYTLSQQLTGLLPNTTYQLSFLTAATQQSNGGVSGRTMDYWNVKLGSEPTQTTSTITNPSLSFTGYDPSAGCNSPSTDPNFPGWCSETLFFTTPNTTLTPADELLTFLAVGTPTGCPPFALLADVNTVAVSEPASLLLMVAGLVALAGFRRQRRLSAV